MARFSLVNLFLPDVITVIRWWYHDLSLPVYFHVAFLVDTKPQGSVMADTVIVIAFHACCIYPPVTGHTVGSAVFRDYLKAPGHIIITGLRTNHSLAELGKLKLIYTRIFLETRGIHAYHAHAYDALAVFVSKAAFLHYRVTGHRGIVRLAVHILVEILIYGVHARIGHHHLFSVNKRRQLHLFRVCKVNIVVCPAVFQHLLSCGRHRPPVVTVRHIPPHGHLFTVGICLRFRFRSKVERLTLGHVAGLPHVPCCRRTVVTYQIAAVCRHRTVTSFRFHHPVYSAARGAKLRIAAHVAQLADLQRVEYSLYTDKQFVNLQVALAALLVVQAETFEACRPVP